MGKIYLLLILTVIIFFGENFNSFSQVNNVSQQVQTQVNNVTQNVNQVQGQVQDQVQTQVNNVTQSINQVQDQVQAQVDNVTQQVKYTQDQANAIINRAKGLAEKIRNEQRYIDRLDETVEVSFPFAITGKGIDDNYNIILDKDSLTKEGMYLTAFMVFTEPVSDKTLVFAANNVLLSASGGIIGDVKLALVDNVSIDKFTSISFIIKSGSFVSFDCSGFKKMGLTADIEFSENLLVLENAADGTILPGKVKTTVSLEASDWNDLIFETSLPSFQIKALRDFGFEATGIVIDFSDFRNPNQITFPDNYQGASVYGSNISLWTGIYIKSASIRLPEIFSKGERKKISAQNLIIDDQGFTGAISAQNIITLEQGNIGGWQYSLDKMNVKFVEGSFSAGSFEGNVLIPLSTKQAIKYNATLDGKGDFLFSASGLNGMEMDVDMLNAKMKIDPASSLSIKKQSNNIVASIDLSGSMSFKLALGNQAKTEDNTFMLSDIRFENLVLSTQSPYVQPGNWSFNETVGNKDKMNGFPVSVNNIKLGSLEDLFNIEFGFNLSLMKDRYSALARLAINGELSEEKIGTAKYAVQKWNFKGIDLKEIAIKVKNEAISLEGYLKIVNDDAVFGNGIAGSITANFVDYIQVQATVMFGNVNNFNYWYVDALAVFKSGIAFGGLSLYGFGGGAYYHMKQDNAKPIMNENTVTSNTFTLGKTPSGISYVPDKASLLGLKATVVLGTTGDPQPFNGLTGFDIAFNNNFGVRSVSFEGAATLMAKLNIGSENKNAPLRANLKISYDFENTIMMGNFEVFVNAAGGMIKGSGANNRAGQMTIYFSKEDWYIHIGRPTNRIALTMDLGFVEVQNTAYFMIGTQIDPLPSPPQKVMDILKLSYVPNTDLSALSSGKGFVFGADFNITTPDLTFLMFYAKFGIGVGFDVMLSNYGEEAICRETNKRIGVNGWYAEGQVYGWVEGDIGINVTVFGSDRSLEILAVQAAILLQAKLPNPFWMKGDVGGRYSVLGGLVKGSCNFKFEVGDQCSVKKAIQEKSVASGITVISNLTPENGKTDVNVFTSPQAVFNFPINQEFTYTDENNKEHSLKIMLDHFKVVANKSELSGAYSWNSSNDVVAFKPTEILPGKTEISISAKIHFEEKVNGTWVSVKENGSTLYETKELTFTSGVAPDYIVEENISFRYPLKDQVNYMKGHHNKAYIKLYQGQAYLFTPPDGFSQVVRFTKISDESVVEKTLSYSNNVVSFDMPELSNNFIYKVQIVNKPTGAQQAVDVNVSASAAKTSNEGGDVEMQTKSAKGSIKNMKEKFLYSNYFRTSMYNTLTDKVNAFTETESFWYRVTDRNIFIAHLRYKTSESFDNEEISQIIKLNANKNGYWLETYQIPLIYSVYPVLSGATVNRDTSLYGLIPIRALDFKSSLINSALTADEKKTGTSINRSSTCNLQYNLPIYTYWDYQDIFTNLANMINRCKGNVAAENILNTSYTGIVLNRTRVINYPVNINYLISNIGINVNKSLDINLK